MNVCTDLKILKQCLQHNLQSQAQCIFSYYMLLLILTMIKWIHMTKKKQQFDSLSKSQPIISD